MASGSNSEGTKASDGDDDMFDYLYEGIGAREEDEAKEKSRREKAERKIRLVNSILVLCMQLIMCNFPIFYESPGVPRTSPGSWVTTPDSPQRETH